MGVDADIVVDVRNAEEQFKTTVTGSRENKIQVGCLQGVIDSGGCPQLYNPNLWEYKNTCVLVFTFLRV